MHIKYIYLKNYKRMPFLNSNIFEYTFTNKLTMISGSNGHGKSQLLNELTPLPPDKAAYHKDGYKEIHIEHNKNMYKLITDFSTNSYKFYINEDNLNLSENITTQRELVYKHFNLNSSIHDLLTGKDTFTGMSLLNRKKLFNSISHINIDSLLNNYNTLKEELKNNTFLLNTQNSLYLAEEQKSTSLEHIDKIHDRKKILTTYMKDILDIRDKLRVYLTNRELDNSLEIVKNIVTDIRYMSKKYYTYLTTHSNENLMNYKIKLEICEYEINSLYSFIETTEQDIKQLELTQNKDISELNRTYTDLLMYKDNIASSVTILINYGIPIKDIINEVHKLEVTLPDIVASIPINENKLYSKTNYDKLQEQLSELHTDLVKCTEEELSINRKLSDKKNIECPKCSYTWDRVDGNESISELDTSIKLILAKKLSIKSAIDSVNKEITKITDYFTIYKQYSNIRSSSIDILKDFWYIVDSNGYIFNNPSEILKTLKQLSNDIVTITEIDEINKKLKELQVTIDTLNRNKDTSKENLQMDIEDHLEDLACLLEEKEELNRLIKTHEYSTKLTARLLDLSQALRSSRSDLFKDIVSEVLQKNIIELESELSSLKVSLIEVDKELINYSNIQHTLNSYSKQIDDTNTNIRLLGYILEEISPKNGIIAKVVSSFINIIISNMTKLIDNVWEYKMELKAIDLEEEVLNYKFKVIVDDSLVIDDISNVSAGMREIINLAFKLVLYRLLGLQDYPIYLDELAANLDSKHSNKILQFIANLNSDDRYSQVFIITHKENINFLREVDVIEL